MQTDQSLNQEPADQAKPLFSVGERQYDAESAAKKIENADSFIDTLKQESQDKDAEIARLRAELDQKGSLETKLDDALQVLRTKETQDMNPQPATSTTEVDVKALQAQLVEQAQAAALESVNKFKQTEIATANQSESIQAAKSRFGSDYETKLREVGTSLGLDDKAINDMAASNPALFKQTFGLNGKPNAQGLFPDGSQASAPPVDKLELQDVTRHWSSSSKVNAQLANESELTKLINKHGGFTDEGINAAKRALGLI